MSDIINEFAALLDKLDEKTTALDLPPTKYLTEYEAVRDLPEYREVDTFFQDNFITPNGNVNYVLINQADDDGRFFIKRGEYDSFGWLSAVIKTRIGSYVVA